MIKVAVIGTGGIANSHLEAYVSSFNGRCQVIERSAFLREDLVSSFLLEERDYARQRL